MSNHPRRAGGFHLVKGISRFGRRATCSRPGLGDFGQPVMERFGLAVSLRLGKLDAKRALLRVEGVGLLPQVLVSVGISRRTQSAPAKLHEVPRVGLADSGRGRRYAQLVHQRLAFDELAGPGNVRLEAYNSAGREVKTLVHGVRPAGPGCVTWDGGDESDRALPGGVYFLKSAAAGQTGCARVLLVR